MTSSIQLKKDVYKPETTLKAGRMISTRTNTSTAGAIEAAYLFKTFPELRPVGPFKDPRKSPIVRFRLEGLDRTGISYVVGKTITLEAIKEIKHRYAETRSERQSKKKQKERQKSTTSKKHAKNARSLLQDDENDSSRVDATVDGREFAKAAIGHDGSPTPNVGTLPFQTAEKEPSEVTLVDLAVDKLITDHRLTQNQKELFLQHAKPLRRECQRNGKNLLADAQYFKYCEEVLVRLYPIEPVDKGAGPTNTERGHLQKANEHELIENLTNAITELDERVSNELADIRKKIAGITPSLAGRGNTDLLSFSRRTLEDVNLLCSFVGVAPFASLGELLNRDGSCRSYIHRPCEDDIDRLSEVLKKQGYTVRTPGEVMEGLRADIIEETRQRQKLESRIHSLENPVSQTGRIIDWMPVILAFVILIIVLAVLVLMKNS